MAQRSSKNIVSGVVPLTYISLFSSAGVGCYGFKAEGFDCIATVELIERRLNIQKHNKKCKLQSGYICNDITTDDAKSKIFGELKLWERKYGIKGLDVLIATPPCQGMSVANHKKKDELKRNSLVVESIKLTKDIKPKYFVFENVRAFLTSVCTDIDGQDKPIREAIDNNLASEYNIVCQILNFKDFGNPSSRTRTLVIGVRKDIKDITPYSLYPTRQNERTLRDIIGHLPSLKVMGESMADDIYHNFRNYSPHMERWISEIQEGQSAFDNTDHTRIPHSIKNGVIVYNARKNGDKYTRQYWDKVAPCIHTRNDIMASQNTVHPEDNRVFSIREVMLMMSVPSSFRWSDRSIKELNLLSDKERTAYLKKEEMNIRQSLGEAVPTVIFQQIARKIKAIIEKKELAESQIHEIIADNNLTSVESILSFIDNDTVHSFEELCKIAELANAKRTDNAAYYTRQDICFSIVNSLPDAKNYNELNILEPSIGVGNFLPNIIGKYQSVPVVNIDVVDIDDRSIEILKLLVRRLDIPQNVNINYIVDDFLLYNFDKRYDIVVGNPPYKKLTSEKNILQGYKKTSYNKDTNNIFSFFIEKAIAISQVVALVVPKSLINSPEFNKTRELMAKNSIEKIIDFGEKGFKGVKIETICFVLNTTKKPNKTIIESTITSDARVLKQQYLTDASYPYWLIYRNDEFDLVAGKLDMGIFKSFRDRSITKSITKSSGRFRVLKSRNVGDNKIIDIDGYDCYIDDIESLAVSKYVNVRECVLIPNLTYNPRACFMPQGAITDGSIAILTLADKKIKVTKDDLAFYATEEFTRFYAIARNLGTRSLNIDNNSVFFFGKLK